jgi:hypothetical protein
LTSDHQHTEACDAYSVGDRAALLRRRLGTAVTVILSAILLAARPATQSHAREST